jgi:hypothetical protein
MRSAGLHRLHARRWLRDGDDARYAFPLGEAGSDVALAPLPCAGLIGWRSLVIAGDGSVTLPNSARNKSPGPLGSRRSDDFVLSLQGIGHVRSC